MWGIEHAKKFPDILTFSNQGLSEKYEYLQDQWY